MKKEVKIEIVEQGRVPYSERNVADSEELISDLLGFVDKGEHKSVIATWLRTNPSFGKAFITIDGKEKFVTETKPMQIGEESDCECCGRKRGLIIFEVSLEAVED